MNVSELAGWNKSLALAAFEPYRGLSRVSLVEALPGSSLVEILDTTVGGLSIGTRSKIRNADLRPFAPHDAERLADFAMSGAARSLLLDAMKTAGVETHPNCYTAPVSASSKSDGRRVVTLELTEAGFARLVEVLYGSASADATARASHARVFAAAPGADLSKTGGAA